MPAGFLAEARTLTGVSVGLAVLGTIGVRAATSAWAGRTAGVPGAAGQAQSVAGGQITTVTHALGAQYRPDGLNLGMNLGRAAGAGVTGHIHMHILPRWVGDANFMTVIGETRVLPEELGVTAERLKPIFERLARGS